MRLNAFRPKSKTEDRTTACRSRSWKWVMLCRRIEGWVREFASWRASRLIPGSIAGVLLLASALKAYYLISGPILKTGLLTSKWFLIPTIELELIIALCLLLGILPRHTRRLAITVFCIFLATSLYQAVIGRSTCGCFGEVHVSPWLTGTIDALAIVALICWRPSEEGEARLRLARRGWMRTGLVSGILLGSVVLTAGALPLKHGQINDDGLISRQGVILVEPSKWLGKRMPLLPYVKTTDNLAAGTWTVLLIHSDCPKCQAVLPTYEEMARDWKERGVSSRVVVVVVPAGRPQGARDRIPPQDSSCTHGRLSDEREWFVQTPTVIKLDEGTVVEAHTL
jgi:hypothetical protein